MDHVNPPIDVCLTIDEIQLASTARVVPLAPTTNVRLTTTVCMRTNSEDIDHPSWLIEVTRRQLPSGQRQPRGEERMALDTPHSKEIDTIESSIPIKCIILTQLYYVRMLTV